MKPRISVVMDDDLKAVFDETKGLVKDSTYANFIMRNYFVSRGLLPEMSSMTPYCHSNVRCD